MHNILIFRDDEFRLFVEALFYSSFSPPCRTVERMSGVAAKELFKFQEDELVERLGEDEGKRLYNELQVQSGAMTVSHFPGFKTIVFLLWSWNGFLSLFSHPPPPFSGVAEILRALKNVVNLELCLCFCTEKCKILVSPKPPKDPLESQKLGGPDKLS